MTITIELLESFKDNKDIGFLDSNLIKKINSMFMLSKNGKSKNKKNKKNYNNSKKQNLKKMKNNFESKINFILNKLTDKNESDILTEFCETIKFESQDIYNNFIIILWKRIILHSSYLDIYINFLLKVIKIYSQINIFETTFEPMIDLVQNKFDSDYNIKSNEKITELLKLPNDLTEEEKNNYLSNYKFNNLEIIKYLISEKILSKKLSKHIKTIISSDCKYSEDLYKWFSNFEKDYETILSFLSNYDDNLVNRHKFLIESLLQDDTKRNNNIEKKILPKKKIEKNILESAVYNLFEEYFFIQEMEEIIFFVNEKCKNENDKNTFLIYLLNFYLGNKQEYCSDIILIIKKLISKKFLTKPNIKNSLKYLEESIETIKIDYLDYEKRIKQYVKMTNSIGINLSLSIF
tara:strand:- start:758 stop:1975 length:1218 start_codon:yes stop_codon:yes gene_type:complete